MNTPVGVKRTASRRNPAVPKIKRKKLSGWARRKMKREAEAAAAGVTLIERPPMPLVTNRLMSVMDWRKEISTIYRAMRSGEIPTHEGTRLVYVSEIGARLAKMEQELQLLEDLRRQLEQTPHTALSPSIDLLPVDVDTDDT